MKTRIFSLFLALSMCLCLSVPVLAANEAGDTTITDISGNSYSLSNKILYTISKSSPPFDEWDPSHIATDKSEFDKIYAVPVGTVITAPSNILFNSYDVYDVVWSDGVPSLVAWGLADFEEVMQSILLDSSNTLWVFSCHLSALSFENFSTEGHTGTIAFYTTDAEHSEANPFESTPNNPSTPSAPSFTDVPANAYYADAVEWAVENNVTSGTSSNSFSPNAPCSRAQVVTFLWRANGSPEPTSTRNPFTDVKTSDYYYKAVLWAVENGITSGTSSNTFSPDVTCTRSQAVTFIYRAEKSPAVDGVNSFADVDSGAYYTDAVTWASKNGITSGTSATAFSPNDDCTRSQIVTFIYRTYTK